MIFFAQEHIGNKQMIKRAQAHFPELYQSRLKAKASPKHSLVARFLVSQLAKQHFSLSDFFPESDSENRPLPRKNVLFWSASYSGDTIFAAISQKPIGIDVENIRPRSETLLSWFSPEEYKEAPSWKIFYQLWTKKEAVLKRFGSGVDEMSLIQKISDNQYDFQGKICTTKSVFLAENLLFSFAV